MTGASNKTISDFTGQPATQSSFSAIAAYVTSLGPVTEEHKAHVGFSVNRKFLWLWAYEFARSGTGTSPTSRRPRGHRLDPEDAKPRDAPPRPSLFRPGGRRVV